MEGEEWRNSIFVLVLCIYVHRASGGSPGGIGFSLGSHLVNEDAGTVTACIDVRINLNAPGQFMIMVITATDGSAQLGTDYSFVGVNISVELVLTLNTECVMTTIIPNDVLEADESFTLNLRTELPPGFAVAVLRDTTVITVVNDDAITISLPAVIHYPEENTTVEVCVNITGSTARDVDIILTKQAPDEGNFDVVVTVVVATVGAGANSSSLECFQLTNNTDRTFVLLLSTMDPDVMIGTSAAAVTVEDTQMQTTESPTSEMLPTTSEPATTDADTTTTTTDTTTTTTDTTTTQAATVATVAAISSNSISGILQDTFLALVPLGIVASFITGVLLGVVVTHCMLHKKPAKEKSRVPLIKEEGNQRHPARTHRV